MWLPFSPSILVALVALALVAGLVRGFSGFGAAMIYVPAASLLIGPRFAVVALWVLDSLPALPIVLPALRKVDWRAVVPVALGYAATVSIGVWWLTHGDPTTLRWAISAFIFAAVAVLWSGFRLGTMRSLPLSLAVGMISGISGGAAQLSGPPVLVYWLAGDDPAWRMRANIIVLFFLTTLASGLAFLSQGLFSSAPLLTALYCAPAYVAGLLIGQRLFGLASEATFRRVAYGVILMVAVLTLPAFDGLLR